MVTRQHLAQARADSGGNRGGVQVAMSVVEQELLTAGYKDSINWEARQLGDCYFWVFTYDVDNPDENTFKFGLSDEASKVDINTLGRLESGSKICPACSTIPTSGAEIVDWARSRRPGHHHRSRRLR